MAEDNAPHQFLQVFPVACDVLASLLLVHGHPLFAQTSAAHVIRTPAKTKERKENQLNHNLCVFCFHLKILFSSDNLAIHRDNSLRLAE